VDTTFEQERLAPLATTYRWRLDYGSGHVPEPAYATVEVVLRGHDPHDPHGWVVLCDRSVWHRDGRWAAEPLPTAREAAHLTDTRFSLSEAATIAAAMRPTWTEAHFGGPRPAPPVPQKAPA
jgi:hypothetical protein